MLEVRLEHGEHERQPLLHIVQVLEGISEMGNQEGSGSRRCLHSGVRHHIQHTLVSVMSDTCDDRQGEVSDILGKGQGVETTHITRRTTTTDDDDDIIVLGMFVDLVQCRYHTLLHLFALHDGRKQGGIEHQSVVVLLQLATEITIACRCRCGDHGDTLTETGNHQFPLQVEDTLCFQLGDDLLAALCHVTQRVVRVDIGDNP